MAGDIKIRLVSELFPQGFNDAVAGMKKVEKAYTDATGKILSDTKGSIPKMKTAYKQILESGMADAPKFAGEYFQNWANALIHNFTGGDSAKLKATIQKAIGEITNIGGEDNLAYVNMTELNAMLAKVASMYDEASTGIESASRRKQASYEKEIAVLQKLGLKSEEYNLTMQNAKAQMMALSPAMKNYESEMERLTADYTNAKTKLAELTAEQEKASKGGLGQYVGTVVKGMLVHQAIAKAISTVKQTLKEASQASAEAEQKMNKLNTVFEGFNETAKATAKELSSTIGVAVSTASSALTTVGDLLQAQGMGVADSLAMAGDWVKKFQDIINFKDINESLDEFSKNMMAGFLGNTRNLRSVGVVVKDSAVQAELASRNMDKLTGSEKELAKMNIRAEMTFKQLDNAMGATEREWDTNLAVNRRLNEAWLQYKENLGDTVNSILKPMKSAWTEVLTQINKANQAQKEFNAGAKEINVYDIKNNEKDAKAFTSEISSIASAYSMGMRNAGHTLHGEKMASADAVTETVIKNLNKQMIIFNASLEDVRKELGDRLTPEIYETLDAMEAERQAEIQRGKDIQSRIGTLTTASEKFDTFQEKLLGITGVNFTAKDAGGLMHMTGSDNAMNFALGAMADFTAQNIDLAIKSIAEADLSVWGDVVSGELEGLDIPKLFEKKMESVADLFSATWNEYLQDGVITDEEKAKLEEIKKLYSELGKELDDYNAKLEKEKNLQSALNSAQEKTTDYQRQLAQIGMSEEQKALSDLAYEYLDQVKTLKLTKSEADKLREQYDAQAKAYIALQKASKEYNDQLEREQKRKDQLSEYSTQGAGYRTQLAQLGMSDRQITEANLASAGKSALASGDIKLASVIFSTLASFEALQNALEKGEIDKKVEEVANQFNASAYDYERATLGMNDNQKALYDLYQSYLDAKAELEAIGGDTDQLTKNYEAQRQALEDLQAITKTYNDQLEREALLKGYSDRSADYRTQLAHLGMSSAEITLDNLNNQAVSAFLAGDKELYDAIWEEIEAFNALQDATKELEEQEKKRVEAEKKAEAVASGWSDLQSKATSSMGTVGSAINTFSDGKGDVWSDILNVLLDIMQQSEYWDDLVEIINQVIEPILPIVEAISYTLVQLDPVFRAISAVLGSISVVIVSVLGAINYVIDFFEWGWDWLKTAFHNLGEVIAHPLNKSARDIEELPNLADYTAETTENMKKYYNEIADAVYGIKKNTDKDNKNLLEAYEKMFANQMITASEFDALVAGINGISYDRVRSYEGSAWHNGNGGTTIVYSGDMKFTIEGTNLSADEIAEAVTRKQQQWASTAQYH